MHFKGHGNMEIPKGVYFSTFQPNWESVVESLNGPVPDLTSNSILVKSVLKFTSSSDAIRKTDFHSTSRGSFNKLKDEKASINRERKVKTSGLDNFREKLFAEGISKSAAERITSAKRQGSITHYESAWGNLDSWCSRKQVDPISGPPNSVPDFLTELFHSGLVQLLVIDLLFQPSITLLRVFRWVNTIVFALSLKRFLIKEHQFQDIHLHGTFRRY